MKTENVIILYCQLVQEFIFNLPLCFSSYIFSEIFTRPIFYIIPLLYRQRVISVQRRNKFSKRKPKENKSFRSREAAACWRKTIFRVFLFFLDFESHLKTTVFGANINWPAIEMVNRCDAAIRFHPGSARKCYATSGAETARKTKSIVKCFKFSKRRAKQKKNLTASFRTVRACFVSNFWKNFNDLGLLTLAYLLLVFFCLKFIAGDDWIGKSRKEILKEREKTKSQITASPFSL